MLDFTPVTDLFGDVGAAVVIGAFVGVVFGIAAQLSRFCLRAAVEEVGRKDYRGQLGVWLAGFGAAIIATQYLVAGDLVETIAVRPLNEAVSLSGAIVGGFVFGIGMMLANGCASRHLVLAGTGNLRAWAVFALFAVTAWATISGPLAPLREGQVFWVHNRVATIDRQAAWLQEQVPEARIVVAHGQMDEGTLEQVVLDFWEGEYDVLVCTTIIESGIDMPTVNTLVVDRADLLGLGQLHQLRGRVGRAGSRAYAYLFHPEDVALSEEAYERLKTIGDATELGSGFRIAMRDLEIRGAGNLLGPQQSGHIAAIGYELYCQLLQTAVDLGIKRFVHISSTAVYGIPDPVKGEAVKASVVLKEGKKASEQEIVDFCRERIAAVKVPRQIEFVDELPKSATGKILKRELQAEAD